MTKKIGKARYLTPASQDRARITFDFRIRNNQPGVIYDSCTLYDSRRFVIETRRSFLIAEWRMIRP